MIITDNFFIGVPQPLDSRYKVITLSQRDSIPNVYRYTGLQVFVHDENKIYVLLNGIANTDWVEIITLNTFDSWGLNGNEITNGQFIGTTNDEDVIIKRNNINHAQFGFLSTAIGRNARMMDNSVIIGERAVNGVSTGTNITAIGNRAARDAGGDLTDTVFIGRDAGSFGTTKFSSIIIGAGSFFNAGNTNNTVGIGVAAGNWAGNITDSVVVGNWALSDAPSCSESVVIGYFAGRQSGGSSRSIFIGRDAGRQDPTQNSIYIGWQAGKAISGNNVGNSNIIIGCNVSLPHLAANRLNIGGVIFGMGVNGTTSGNPNIEPVTNPQIGIGIVTPHTSSILDLTSTNRGLLIPRLTTIQRDAITSPANGLQIYNTDNNQVEHFNGTFWETIIKKIKTETTTITNSTTLEADPELFINLTPGTWQIEMDLLSSGSAGGWRFQFTGPSLSTFTSGYVCGTVFNTTISRTTSTSTNTVVSSRADGAGFLVRFTYDCDSSGVLTLNWAQNSTNASGCSILAKSILTAKRIN